MDSAMDQPIAFHAAQSLDQHLGEKSFYNSLPAHIELSRSRIKLSKHPPSEINIHSLYRPNHFELISEVGRDILLSRCFFRDFVSSQPAFRRFRHNFALLAS